MNITNIHIQNYKTLTDVSIDLGRVNIFIGPNSVGKSALLEAIGLISAGMVERLDDRLIESRGVRLGTPYLYKSSFRKEKTPSCMSFSIEWKGDDLQSYKYRFSLNAPLDQSNYTWKFHSEALTLSASGKTVFGRSGHSASFDEYDGIKIAKDRSMYGVLKDVVTASIENLHLDWGAMDITKQIGPYGIYSPNTLMLRGLAPDISREPIGLYGGGLPEAVSSLVQELNNYNQNSESSSFTGETKKLCDELLFMNDWYYAVEAGHRNKKILSPNVNAQNKVLRFRDRFMNENRDVITAYDANEGALYALFLACLLFLPSAPSVFAIDNVDYGLNPRMARKVASVFSRYADLTDKTICLTTHNPLLLDGLDLRSENVRLFVLDRNRKGHTKVNRIILDDTLLSSDNCSLSNLWISGQLGGMPNL